MIHNVDARTFSVECDHIITAPPSVMPFAAVAKQWVLIFSDVEQTHLWRELLESQDYRYVRTGAWVKQPAFGWEACTIAHSWGQMPQPFGPSPVWRHDSPYGIEQPLALLLEVLERFTKPGDVVCDPFMGTGTVVKAAHQSGRRFVGIDIDPERCREVEAWLTEHNK